MENKAQLASELTEFPELEVLVFYFKYFMSSLAVDLWQEGGALESRLS